MFGLYRLVFGPYRAVFGSYRAVFGLYRLVFGAYRAVFGPYRVMFGQCGAVLGPYRAVFGAYRAVFGPGSYTPPPNNHHVRLRVRLHCRPCRHPCRLSFLQLQLRLRLELQFQFPHDVLHLQLLGMMVSFGLGIPKPMRLCMPNAEALSPTTPCYECTSWDFASSDSSTFSCEVAPLVGSSFTTDEGPAVFACFFPSFFPNAT